MLFPQEPCFPSLFLAPSTPTRSTSLCGSLWRQNARLDPYTPYMQDWKQIQAQRKRRQLSWKGEAKTQMKTKQRRREEDGVEPQGEGTQRLGGQQGREPDSLPG